MIMSFTRCLPVTTLTHLKLQQKTSQGRRFGITHFNLTLIFGVIWLSSYPVSEMTNIPIHQQLNIPGAGIVKTELEFSIFDRLKSLKVEFQIINSNQRVSKLSRDGSRSLTRSGIIFQESSRWPCWPCALFHRKYKWNLLDPCRR